MDRTGLDEAVEGGYRAEDYPALGDQMERWAARMPLKGLSVLDATPVFRNTLTKHRALLRGGAKLTVGISKVMPFDPEAVRILRESGIAVVRPEEIGGMFDIVLDCAAAFASVQARIGYAELTRSGVPGYRDAKKPVWLADGGTIKRIETTLGTGESYFRAMRQLGYGNWKGRRLVVFGSGKVGSGIVMQASRLGARITVVSDPAQVSETVGKQAAEIVDFRRPERVAEAVMNAYAVVAATGVRHALEKDCPPEVWRDSPALLANMGVEDEFGPSVPAERVLEGKRTLNFILAEPTHLKYIDATLALHNEGAVWLAEGVRKPGIALPAAETEQKILEVTRRNGTIGGELDLLGV